MALVHPHVEYASTVWNPYPDELNRQVETIQRQSTRYILVRFRKCFSEGNEISHVTEMLDHHQWQAV